MSHQIQPFTWIVRFDVAPEWVADGFSLCDERALEMLSRETSGCMSTELAARVIAAPAPGRIVAEQGYPKQGARTAAEIQSLVSGAPHAYCSGARHHAAPRRLWKHLPTPSNCWIAWPSSKTRMTIRRPSCTAYASRSLLSPEKPLSAKLNGWKLPSNGTTPPALAALRCFGQSVLILALLGV